MKRRKLIMVLCLSIIMFCSGTIYAMAEIEVINYFETGIIDIELVEYQKKGEEEQLWEEPEVVLPGDVISKIPRIYNKGNDCYIRANIQFGGMEVSKIEGVTIGGIGSQWILAPDGYYYYTKILPTGSQVDLFQTVSIPEDLSPEAQGKTFLIDIDVDAIQSQNINPQFSAQCPWGNIEILNCEKEGQYDITSFKKAENQTFHIVYQGESASLITNNDDFFKNFPYMMPGDCYKETIGLKNKSNEVVELYFRSNLIENEDLLKQVRLKIQTIIEGKTNVFFEGTLQELTLEERTLLCAMPKYAEGELYFELMIPKEMNNAYHLQNGKIVWIFSTEPIVDEELIPDDSAQTGDDHFIGVPLCCMGISLGIIAILGLKKESEETHE